MGERNFGHRPDEYAWAHEPRHSRVNWLRITIYGGSVALVLGTLGACAATFWN